MKSKLKRKYARLCLILIASGVICMLVPFVLTLSGVGKYWIIVGAILLFSAAVVKHIFLKCPYCGFRGLMPQWTANGTYHCPGCGEKVLWE